MDQNNSEEKTKQQLRNQKRKEKKKLQKEASDQLAKQVEEEVKQNIQTDNEKYVLELTWCIKQLKLGLTQQLTPQQMEESLQVITLLEDATVPVIKKRVVMKQVFGDYRKLMKKYK